MFVKINKVKQYEYIKIVESYRDEKGVPRHRVILNLGRLNQLKNNPSFAKVLEHIQEIIGVKNTFDLEDISEAEILNWGHMVYKKLWERYGLSELLKNIQNKTNRQFDLNETCYLMVLEHLLSPKSKLGMYNCQDRYFGQSEISLHHLYRSLDLLCEYKEYLEEKLFYRNASLFNMSLDIVFYDVTTFYFESVRTDSLKAFGYSKDGKFNNVQVVLGLLVDTEGRPVGYEIFSGDTFDGSTLELMLDKLHKRFNIRRIIIVADRGINSKLNLKKIKDKGYGYIFASRIKNLPDNIQRMIFNPEGYISIGDNGFRYKVIDYENKVKAEDGTYKVLPEKLVVSYSPQRTAKDKSDRERLLKKAIELLEHPQTIASSFKRGGRKYIKKEDKTEYTLDIDAILRDERFDGYYGIQCSESTLTPKEVMDAYHGLWKMEESFRIMKTTLEVRPVFHWTEKRIKGHFVVCFLAFLMERALEFNLKEAKENMSPDKIRCALNSMNFASVFVNGKNYLIKTKQNDEGNRILRALRIKPPKNISTPDTV